jgi:hypothetical protein
MKPKLYYLTIFLLLTFILASAGMARSGILESASQMVNLTVNGAVVPVDFPSFQQVLPDGTSQPFTLPSGKVFVITKVIWSFYPQNTSFTGSAQLRFGTSPTSIAFYSKRTSFTNGGGSGENDNIPTGIPIAVWTQSYGAYVVNLADNTLLPGTLFMRVVGFIAPNQ